MIDWTRVVEAFIIILPQLLIFWRQGRQAKRIDDVHNLVNSQTDKLIKVATEAATVVGEAAGVEKERKRKEGE